MDLSELLEKIEDILYDDECYDPNILIQIGNMVVPLTSIKHYPEDEFYLERIILS